ncbi:MAG: DUF2490 domain-containing protein, partial [Rikenellaceae bacterium]
MRFKRIIVFPLLLLCGVVYAGDGTRDDVENVDKYRFGMNVGIKLAKGLKLNISPEFRFNEGLDEFMLNGGVSYRTFGCMQWGASYRLVCDREVSGVVEVFNSTRTEYEWAYFHRYAFDVGYKDDFGRFTPSFRLRYNNFTSGDEGELRYRAKLEYNIKKCKFTPEISVEAFQSEEYDYMFSKMRYSAGFEYKFNKKSAFAFDYKL